MATSGGRGPNGGFWLAKTDWLGNIQWTRTYAAPGNDTVNWAFTKTSDGGYALVGHTNVDSSAPNATGVRIWVLKTDSDGNAQWNQTYGGPNTTEGRSIIQTSDGGYAIAGQVDTYEEVNTNWPPFVYLTKLSYSTQPTTSPTSYLLPAAVAIAVIIAVVAAVAVVLRKKAKPENSP
jgi:hypothetical protein